jgi:hypothetical protein
MTRPSPILIGYFPKKTAKPDAWFGETIVEEIGSVSCCISEAPENWIEHWKHNTPWGLFDTEALAWSVLSEERSAYDMYAYRIFPVIFDGAKISPIVIESAAVENLSEYDFLGYDSVSQEGETILGFSHSPFSCNHGFDRYPVNRFCLLDDLEAAWRITGEIAQESSKKHTWEPGPYYLCEVYRKHREG